MQPTSRLETLLNHPRTVMKLQALVSDLRERVQLLDSDIQDEEKRTGISMSPTRPTRSLRET